MGLVRICEQQLVTSISRKLERIPRVYMSLLRVSSFYVNSVVRGYHVYQSIWVAPIIGEQLPAAREPGNSHDTYAVAVKKDGITVDHSPKTVCCIFFYGEQIQLSVESLAIEGILQILPKEE